MLRGAVVLAFASACGGQSAPPPLSSTAPIENRTSCGKDDCLPHVAMMDVSGVDQSRFLDGKIVVVHFWATWAHPAVKDLTTLNNLAEKHAGQGVRVLGVLGEAISAHDLEAFIATHRVSYPIIPITPDIAAAYNYPQAYPTTFVFDRTGARVQAHVGMSVPAELDALLTKLTR